MTDLARQRAAAEGLPATFEVGDAQTHPLGPGSFDVAVSRFGVMFFDDPVAAFTNIASGLRSGGRLAFVCWQELFANDWMIVPGAAVAAHVPLPDTGGPDAPGPFAFADPARVEAVLTSAGFTDIACERVREPLLLGGGPTLDGTLEFLRTSGLGQAVLGDADPELVDRAMAAVRAAIEPHLTSDGVVLDGAVWVVTAHTPG
jgi:SAM-dependent methyltransferase